MATLSNTNTLNASATAHIDVQPVQDPKADAAAAAGLPQALPAAGMVLAQAVAYRTINRGLLSHTAGVVVRQGVTLKLVPGGGYQLLVSHTPQANNSNGSGISGSGGGAAATPQEQYLLDAADWELRPASLDEVVATVHTLKAAGDTTKQVVLAGEFEGEDLPLFDIEIKYRGGLKNALLHPNTAGAAHELEEGQSKLVRIGFEEQQEAREWYALLAIALGVIDLDSPTLATLPKALAASKSVRSFKEAA